MKNSDSATLLTDPTLGGILGDGTARVRRLVCKTTRTHHSDPEGFRDPDASINDQFEITFDIENEPDCWLPARLLLNQSCYQGAHINVQFFSCGTQCFEIPSATTGHRSQVYLPLLDTQHASSYPAPPVGGPGAILKMQTWFMAHILLICTAHGAELGPRDPAGSVKQIETPEPQTLQLCKPSQCHYVPWGCILSSPSNPNLFGEVHFFQRMAALSTPADALNLIYHQANYLEPWQLAGLVELGMPTRWEHMSYSFVNNRFCGKTILIEPHAGGLMHEAVSFESKFTVAEPWRLHALATLVDPGELDSLGLTAKDLVQAQINTLSLNHTGTGATEKLNALLGAAAFFEALTLRESLPGLSVPRPAGTAVRL